MPPCTLVNGSTHAAIDPGDRGFSLGDGLFETIAVRAGRPRRWSTHLQRLAAGCIRLGLPKPDPDELLDEAHRVIDRDHDGVLRITLTRGPGPPGYAPPDPATPTRVVRYTALAEGLPAQTCIALRTCSLRLAVQPALAGIKHLNRLEQILARSEWSDTAIAEGLMYDTGERLVEATASNVFLVMNGVLRTPRLDRNGVAGVARSCVLAAAIELGCPCNPERLGADDLAAADEVFLANSLHGIRPVRMIDGKRWPSPGPLTAELAQAINDLEQVTYRTE